MSRRAVVGIALGVVLFAGALFGGVLSGCAASPGRESGPQATPERTPGPMSRPHGSGRAPVSGLDAPWSVVFAGSAAILSERDTGRIFEVTYDGGARRLAHLRDIVFGGEGGLLGLAVAPGGGALCAYSTGGSGNRVQRFPLRGAPGSLKLGTPETVIDGLPQADRHNGGRLAFGPDGRLYVTVGDASQSELAQDQTSLAGKILRYAADGSVPADNPFPGSPVYSMGHRNPQGIAWDADGTMYASEFGQSRRDELNVITPGANYGWPVVEGIAGDRRFTGPMQEWSPSQASPSGIAIAAGTIFVANLRGERLRAIPLDNLATHSEHLVGELGRIRDVVVTPEGELWILTNNTDGRGSPRAGDDWFLDSGVIEADG